ncbi:MAG: response regulator [Steroidobacteraceae bacterium]
MQARILVIEDDPASLELLKYLLESTGHDVHTAVDGAAGLRAALESEYELILCDLQMPHLNGYEVIARLREDARRNAVPVIAVTAYSMPGDRDAALEAGFAEYLTKPVDPETFVATINRFLETGHLPGPA